MPDRHDDEALEGLDAPRRMPPGLRERIEAGLLRGPAAPIDAGELLAGVDAPRPLPALARARIERALRQAAPAPVARQRSASWRWAAAAAVVVALLSSVTSVENREPPVEVAGGEEVDSGLVRVPDALFTPDAPPDEAGVGNPGFAPLPPPPGEDQLFETASAVAAGTFYDGPPPFAFEDVLAPVAVERPRDASPRPAPFRISVIGGDVEAEAGFRAYVGLRNERAAPWARLLEIVTVGRPADVTVNLSGSPVANMSPGVRIESLLAPDRMLRDDVFGFAGAVDRQAHLIVDVVYPEPVNATAAIYRAPGGVLHDEVVDALQSALRERGVRTIVRDVGPIEPVVPVLADAVFLSLTPDDAKRVVDAYPERTRPPRGFNGIGTLAESAAVLDLPPGTRFISPYSFPSSQEAETLKGRTGLPAGARLFHGWVVAKTLSVALWTYRPETPEELREALRRMERYANGFAPAYTYRPGTNSVRPEGVLFVVGQDGASQSGGFLTDPRG